MLLGCTSTSGPRRFSEYCNGTQYCIRAVRIVCKFLTSRHNISDTEVRLASQRHVSGLMMKETQHALLCRGAVVAWVARVGGAGVPAAFILWLYLLVLVLEYQVLEYYYSYTARYLARYSST